MDAPCFENEAYLLSIIRNEFTERSAFYRAAQALGLVGSNKKIILVAQTCPSCETALFGKLISGPHTVTAARQGDLVIVLTELPDLDRVADLMSSDTGFGRIGISEPFGKPEFLSVAYRTEIGRAHV